MVAAGAGVPAHATSPQLGQGTGLALLDALALRDALRSHPELPAALERCTALRLAHHHCHGQASRRPVAGPLARQTPMGVQTGWAAGATIALP